MVKGVSGLLTRCPH